MSNIADIKVVVVSVTYGQRWHLLRRVLSSVFNQGVECAIVVDNGSLDTISKNAMKEFGEKVQVIRLETNTGSAKGYASGILKALECDFADLLWLLDDDNCPCLNALDRLLAAYQRLGSAETNVLLSLRRDRAEYLHVALTGTPLVYRCNTFQGFHLCDIPLRLINKKLQNKASEIGQEILKNRLVPISYAPYGGLLLHRNWITKIGIPDERFYLYGDDHEYTFRILSQGGKIFLCTDSEIEDIELSWNSQKEKVPAFFLDSVDTGRLFYSLRNRVYFEKKSLNDSTLIYLINMVAYLSYLVVKSIFLKVPMLFVMKRLLLVYCAIKDGLSGKLGKIEAGRLV